MVLLYSSVLGLFRKKTTEKVPVTDMEGNSVMNEDGTEAEESEKSVEVIKDEPVIGLLHLKILELILRQIGMIRLIVLPLLLK